MTDKREKVSTDPGLGPTEPPGPATLRSIEAAEHASSISPNMPVYYAPAPLVAVSDHRTLELETVKLSDDIDPRKLVTELRLAKVPSVIPPSDSGWPPQTALSSSQPPIGPARRWRTPVVLLGLLGALLLLVLARAATRRSGATAEPVTARPAATGDSAGPALARAPANAVVATALPAAPAVVARPVASAASAEVSAVSSAHGEPGHRERAPVRALLVRRHSVKSTPQPSAPLVAPGSSKPKRAIY